MLKRNQYIKKIFRSIFISSLLLMFSLAHASESPAISNLNNSSISQPAISIIIDDMGNLLKTGYRAVNLPGAITYSFLPHAPYVKKLSRHAYKQNKEVMLHLPMESESGKKLGIGGLTENMTEKIFFQILKSNIDSIPYVSGFNNHMGSLLTKNELWMTRLMRQIASEKRLFFVDSKTTSDSVALKIARAEGLQSTQRDIFIDHEGSKEFIQKQLGKLIKKARQSGTALAIGHPKKITLSILEEWLPKLESKGIKLVPVSKLIQLKQQRKLVLWKNPVKY